MRAKLKLENNKSYELKNMKKQTWISGIDLKFELIWTELIKKKDENFIIYGKNVTNFNISKQLGR